MIDNRDNGTVSASPAFTAATARPRYFGADYLTDGGANKGSATATFELRPTVTGSYEVYAWYPSDLSAATNVPVTVTHAGGSDAVTVDQTSGGGAWSCWVGTT